MSELIDRQAAIDAVHEEFDDCLVWDESGQRTADEFEIIINRLPPAQPETDGLDAVRRARRIMWDKCKKYVAEHTDEVTPILCGKYQKEYTDMTNDVQALSRAIYIMEGMKNRGEI